MTTRISEPVLFIELEVPDRPVQAGPRRAADGGHCLTGLILDLDAHAFFRQVPQPVCQHGAGGRVGAAKESIAAAIASETK